ncbi:MAG: hypothetical protein WD649_05550 [Thermoleophilaceae bacterium]
MTLATPSSGRLPAWLSRLPWWRLSPTLVAATLAIVFLATDPRPVDLASHVFRAELFGDQGFSIWNGQWYSGHHTPGYSVLAPALGWLLGPALMGALSAVAAAALFEQLSQRHFGERARLGALWFGAGTATMLFTGRVTFALGVALALGALVLLDRRRTVFAAALALLCALASPVAALFLGLAGVALAVERATVARRDRNGPRAPLVLATAALAPPLLFAIAFPEGGEHPFPLSSYVAIPLFGLACLVLLPARERALRIGAALYVAGGTAAFLIETPLGGNSVRLGALVGGPLIACALAVRGADETLAGRLPRTARAVAIALALAALAFWQVSPAVRDIEKVSGDPAAEASYYAPLNTYLARQPGPFRVEIPFTRSHWEAAEVAPRFALARGWERQLDTKHNEVFYEGTLDDRRYERWLRDNGVRLVALPDATLDAHGEEEGALVERDPPYLRLRTRLDHWRVYEVLPRPSLVSNEGRARVEVVGMGSDELLLDVERPGSAIVKVRWSPYWRARGACVERGGDWTRVDAPRPGRIELGISFAPLRSLSHGRRCG